MESLKKNWATPDVVCEIPRTLVHEYTTGIFRSAIIRDESTRADRFPNNATVNYIILTRRNDKYTDTRGLLIPGCDNLSRLLLTSTFTG